MQLLLGRSGTQSVLVYFVWAAFVHAHPRTSLQLTRGHNRCSGGAVRPLPLGTAYLVVRSPTCHTTPFVIVDQHPLLALTNTLRTTSVPCEGFRCIAPRSWLQPSQKGDSVWGLGSPSWAQPGGLRTCGQPADLSAVDRHTNVTILEALLSQIDVLLPPMQPG